MHRVCVVLVIALLHYLLSYILCRSVAICDVQILTRREQRTASFPSILEIVPTQRA